MGEIKMKELGSIRNDTLDRYNAYRKDGLRSEADRFLPLRVYITTLP